LYVKARGTYTYQCDLKGLVTNHARFIETLNQLHTKIPAPISINVGSDTVQSRWLFASISEKKKNRMPSSSGVILPS
jgi:hypothetical protein